MLRSAASLLLAAILCGLPAFPQSATDQAIAKMAGAIHKELATLTDYSVFDVLNFSIKDGVVTLNGFASRPTLKSSAEAVVKKVEGVREVVNNIKVLPLSPNDDQIRAKVFAAIYLNPALSIYNPNYGSKLWSSPASITNNPPPGYFPVHIVVQSGDVFLIGFMNNAGDRAIAYAAASSVPGVFNVTNDIQIPPPDEINNKHKKKGHWW
jgi:hyperosmotically inducible periplasmic protein